MHPPSKATSAQQQQSNGSSGDNKRQQQNGGGNHLPPPTSFQDVILGVLTPLARKYLFIDAYRKAVAYFTVIAALSLIAQFVDLPDGFYIAQKHNIFNRFGTKLGWFWTLLLLCPFTWLTSLLHHESKLKASFDMFRLMIATGFWYFCTNSFIKFENHTGLCDGSAHSMRADCHEQGGKWIPGFDISGHAFLLLYSILIICEESTSFRNWPSNPRVSAQHIPSPKDYEQFQQITKFLQWNFVLLFLLHVFWDFQLVITVLYYHNIWQKLIGAFFAVFSWAVTYRLWFVVGFPFLPIRRHIKSF